MNGEDRIIDAVDFVFKMTKECYFPLVLIDSKTNERKIIYKEGEQ